MSSFWFVVLFVYGVDREEGQETNTLEIENDFWLDRGRARPALGRQSGSNGPADELPPPICRPALSTQRTSPQCPLPSAGQAVR